MKKKKQDDCRAPRHFFLKSEGMGWAPPRKETSWSGWEEAKDGKKHVGGWSQKGKRKCQKSLSCRTRWKALSWTWMAKAAVSR